MTREVKYHCSPSSSISPSSVWWVWHHMVWNVPCVNWGLLSQLGLLPTPCAPPVSLLVGWDEEQEKPWLHPSPAQQQQKHPFVTSTVSSWPKPAQWLTGACNPKSACVFVTFMSLLFQAELSQHRGPLRLLFFLCCPVKSFSTSSDQLAETSLDEDVSVLDRVYRPSAHLVFSKNLFKEWKRWK